MSLASKYASVSNIPSSLELNLFPWSISWGLPTASSRWGPDLENRVGVEAIQSVVHVVLLSLWSTCNMVHCLGERALFSSSFVASFWGFLTSNTPIMLYNIRYWWFFLSQGNQWTKYLVHPKIQRPKPCLLMFVSLVALDSFHLWLSTQLTADLTPEWRGGSMFHPLSPIYAKTVVKLKGRTCRLLSPMSQLGFIVQRDHEWRAVIYKNSAIVHGWIKIKEVVNRVTTKLCELNSFHSNTERKKQEVMSKMAYLEVQKWCECILHVDYRKYRKMEAWALLGVQFVGPASRLICKLRLAKNQYKRCIVGRGISLVTSLQNRANQCIDLQVRVRERNRETRPVASS